MPIPTPITDALSKVQADAEATAAARDEVARTASALAAAQHAADTSVSALRAAIAQQRDDLRSLVELETATYDVPDAATP